ncbi:unnamed protein product [Cunninghamella echinulata]
MIEFLDTLNPRARAIFDSIYPEYDKIPDFMKPDEYEVKMLISRIDADTLNNVNVTTFQVNHEDKAITSLDEPHKKYDDLKVALTGKLSKETNEILDICDAPNLIDGYIPVNICVKDDLKIDSKEAVASLKNSAILINPNTKGKVSTELLENTFNQIKASPFTLDKMEAKICPLQRKLPISVKDPELLELIKLTDDRIAGKERCTSLSYLLTLSTLKDMRISKDEQGMDDMNNTMLYVIGKYYDHYEMVDRNVDTSWINGTFYYSKLKTGTLFSELLNDFINVISYVNLSNQKLVDASSAILSFKSMLGTRFKYKGSGTSYDMLEYLLKLDDSINSKSTMLKITTLAEIVDRKSEELLVSIIADKTVNLITNTYQLIDHRYYDLLDINLYLSISRCVDLFWIKSSLWDKFGPKKITLNGLLKSTGREIAKKMILFSEDLVYNSYDIPTLAELKTRGYEIQVSETSGVKISKNVVTIPSFDDLTITIMYKFREKDENICATLNALKKLTMDKESRDFYCSKAPLSSSVLQRLHICDLTDNHLISKDLEYLVLASHSTLQTIIVELANAHKTNPFVILPVLATALVTIVNLIVTIINLKSG